MVNDKYKPALPPRVMKISEQIRRGLMRDPMKERRHRRPRSAFDFPGGIFKKSISQAKFDAMWGTKEEQDALASLLNKYEHSPVREAFAIWLHGQGVVDIKLNILPGNYTTYYSVKFAHDAPIHEIGCICEPDIQKPTAYVQMMRRVLKLKKDDA